MKEFTVSLGGYRFLIIPRNDNMYRAFKNYLTDEAPDFTVILNDEMRNRELQEGSLPFGNHPIYADFLALHREISSILLEKGVLMFHGSAVEVDGESFLFVAPSGTGKSTHTALWRKVLPGLGHEVIMINDDKPFVSVSGGTAFVHGSPWSGDKWLNTNKKSPLKAICLLERDERNHIERAALSEIFPRLLGVFFRGETPEQLKRSLDLFDEIAECCNFYRLGCNMEDEAAVIAYTYMKENNK